MVKEPTGSGGEPSSPNFVVSAGVKARHPPFLFQPSRRFAWDGLAPRAPDPIGRTARDQRRARDWRRLTSKGDFDSRVVRAPDSIITAQKMKNVTV